MQELRVFRAEGLGCFVPIAYASKPAICEMRVSKKVPFLVYTEHAAKKPV